VTEKEEMYVAMLEETIEQLKLEMAVKEKKWHSTKIWMANRIHDYYYKLLLVDQNDAIRVLNNNIFIAQHRHDRVVPKVKPSDTNLWVRVSIDKINKILAFIDRYGYRKDLKSNTRRLRNYVEKLITSEVNLEDTDTRRRIRYDVLKKRIVMSKYNIYRG
jgi:hypothetical protein